MRTLLIMSILLFSIFGASYGQSDLSSCQAIRKGDTLILGNSLIQRTYLFQNGNLSSMARISIPGTDQRSNSPNKAHEPGTEYLSVYPFDGAGKKLSVVSGCRYAGGICVTATDGIWILSV